MAQNTFTLELISKTLLTHDVYELVYRGSDIPAILPGQFLLCDCDATNPRLRRSYSVSWVDGDLVYFIVKRIPDGKGGSIALCDQNISHNMQVWGPMGHFVLRDTDYPKVFIGTGTGFAPLYFMLRKCLEESGKGKAERCGSFFLFGVRELRDVFYQDQLQQLSENSSFDYEIYCSREDSLLSDKHHPGRVTDYLKKSFVLPSPPVKGGAEGGGFNKSIKPSVEGEILECIEKRKGALFNPPVYDHPPGQGGYADLFPNPETEFYICGSPAMVAEVRSILDLNNISKEKVFFEQY